MLQMVHLIFFFLFVGWYMLQVRLNLQVNSFPNQVILFQPRSICFKLDQLVSTLRSTCFDLDPFGAGKKHMSEATSHRDEWGR